MILDFHAHIFPPRMIQERESLAAADPSFATMYAASKARMADADDLTLSMETAGIDASVALGFAWRDEALIREHNDYLLDRAPASGGRIHAFCSLPLAASWRAVESEMDRCLAKGAKGFGELRPEALGFDLSGVDGPRLGGKASEGGSVLLFHASEPVGHAYAGKSGLSLGPLYEFIAANPQTKIVAAHWGGGLPFYALMPEVLAALTNVRFDSAASSLLYTHEVYATVAGLTGEDSILFGSDFPLLEQGRSRRRIEKEAALADRAQKRILGENGREFLDLP